MKIASIVEGDGEVEALPVLLRKLPLTTRNPYIDILKPLRVKRDRFLNNMTEFNRFIEMAIGKASGGWVLILLDADDDCPAQKGNETRQKINAQWPHARISLVFAKSEYEAWFICCADTLNGKHGFTYTDPVPENPENIRNAKGWVKQRMIGETYGEIRHLPKFTAHLDIETVRKRSRSFQKLYKEWETHVG
jgi:hypothetical protein